MEITATLPGKIHLLGILSSQLNLKLQLDKHCLWEVQERPLFQYDLYTYFDTFKLIKRFIAINLYPVPQKIENVIYLLNKYSFIIIQTLFCDSKCECSCIPFTLILLEIFLESVQGHLSRTFSADMGEPAEGQPFLQISLLSYLWQCDWKCHS